MHTHNHALTCAHLYAHRHAQHEHSTDTSSQHHIPKHHLTHHNFHVTCNQNQYIYVCTHLHYYHPTSHRTKIISPHTHTHIHIRITCACNHIYYKLPLSSGTHIVNTLPKWHTCTCTYIHTHTNSPTITPPSLSYFLFPCCFSMLSLSLVKLLTCGVIRSYNFFVHFSKGGVCILWTLSWNCESSPQGGLGARSRASAYVCTPKSYGAQLMCWWRKVWAWSPPRSFVDHFRTGRFGFFPYVKSLEGIWQTNSQFICNITFFQFLVLAYEWQLVSLLLVSGDASCCSGFWGSLRNTWKSLSRQSARSCLRGPCLWRLQCGVVFTFQPSLIPRTSRSMALDRLYLQARCRIMFNPQWKQHIQRC